MDIFKILGIFWEIVCKFFGFIGKFFGRIFWRNFLFILLKSANLFESERDWCFCQDFVSIIILLQKEYQLIASTKKRWWHVRFLPSCTSVICHTLTKSKNCSRLNFWIYTSFVQVHDRAHDLPRHFQTKKGFLSPPYSTLKKNYI